MKYNTLAHEETMLSKETILEYLEKVKRKELTPKDVEFLFVSMSEESQDKFLESMKNILDEKEWEALVMHLKSYDMLMIGDFRQKAKLIKENMGLSLYDAFTSGTSEKLSDRE